MVDKKLYRSRTEKMIGGVCGGIAEYFDVDPTIVRVIWVLVCLAVGSGVLIYIIAYLIIPEKPLNTTTTITPTTTTEIKPQE
ncbi:MAG: PspC domain-containing protein [Methanosphaera sp. SHI613]|nr:MAG: PspC domain-containing protein [Methanosphaera sp. SHI613]